MEIFGKDTTQLFTNEKKKNTKIKLPFYGSDNDLVEKYLMDKIVPEITFKHKFYYNYVRPVVPLKTRRNLQAFLSKKIGYKKDFIDDNLLTYFKDNNSFDEQKNTLYPGSLQNAIILTHDIDDEEGLSQIPRIIELEEKYGFKSCWFIVPYKYKIREDIIKLLKDAGHEVGVHGYNHDGKTYLSKKNFSKRLPFINSAIEKLGATGFRSPMVHRNLEWVQELNIKYEASCFDYDPYQPFPDHTSMIWPFIVGKLVELPYTIPQDHTLFFILKQKDITIWENKIKWLVKNHGMILTLTHPEYYSDKKNYEKYENLLVLLNSIENAWRCLPGQIAEWWLERDKSINY
jgi:peptidoglycan/xylan/chitin deacetylase (PgdA/CDA1 family)